MQQLLISFSVAIIGLFVLTHEAQLVQSKAIHAVNATNATNASAIIVADLAKNLSHALELIQNLTHKLEHITLNQTNASCSVNGSRIHSAPMVNQTRLVTLNQTNSSSPVNVSRIHSAPMVNQTRLHTLNQNNSTGPSHNSSLVPVQNITQVYQLTLQNSRQIDALAQNVSRLADFIYSLGSFLNQTQNSTQNSSRIIHFPVVSQHLLTPLNGTNSTGPAQNSTGPSQNATRIIHQAPVVIASNATAVNATQVHQLNQTQAIAQNLTHLQEVIGNLTQKIQQIKLF